MDVDWGWGEAVNGVMAKREENEKGKLEIRM
jgi:hypothetical protein